MYAIAGPPVYGSPNDRSWDFNIEVPLWGVTWGVSVFRIHKMGGVLIVFPYLA